MRKHARKDGNHKEIVETLRRLGLTVFDTASLGNGFPDLVVGGFGVNLLVEVKDGSAPPSQQHLTPEQMIFINQWRGLVYLVASPADCLSVHAIMKNLGTHNY